MDIVHLNSELITPKVALEAVRKNGEVLNSVPRHSITAEVAEAAVRNWPEAIQWVPRKLRTPRYLPAGGNMAMGIIRICSR